MSLKSYSARLDDRHGPSLAEELSAKPVEIRDAILAKLTQEQLANLKYDWKFWGRANQFIPDGNWQTWMIKAGRGFGKTRVGAETVRTWVKTNPIVNIIAPTADDARDICIEGESGILSICPEAEKPKYLSSKRRLEWPNGAVSLIFTADEPERLRGKQHMKLWCDELAAWRYLEEAWDQAQFGLRLGDNPQSIVTTTPKPLPEVKELLNNPTTFLTSGTTYENRRNLAKAFYQRIIVKYEGTRLGRQELNAELLEDNPGALFHRTNIDLTRCDGELFWKVLFAKLIRIVGAIDPAVTSNEDSDETGIIFAGMLRWEDVPQKFKELCKHETPHFFTFDDRSDIYTPDGWARAALAGYKQFKADRLVGETNNGGEMIESTLRHQDQNVSYIAIHASRGKQTRAEPISALYEQCRVHHVGSLGTLEDQMCDWDPAVSVDSPDRLDANVWALTELSEHSRELGLVNFLKKPDGAASTLEQLNDQKSVPASAVVAEMLKGTTSSLSCPNCQSALVSKIAGGQNRCQQCGHQFWTNGGAPEIPHMTRAYVEGLRER